MKAPEIRSVLDTSVVMRLLTGQPEGQAVAARRYMAEVEEAGAKVYVSNLVVMEAYFACQHHYGMAKEDVIEGLRKLLSVPTFMTHPELQGLLAMEGLARAKLGLLDRLIHAEARTARLESVTFEKAAGRLGGVRLLASAE